MRTMIDKTIAHYNKTSKLGLRPKPKKGVEPQRTPRAQRQKKENSRGASLSVLQGRKNLKFFPDNVTGEDITPFNCNGLWTRAKAQSRQEENVIEIFAAWRLERVKRVGARHFF